MLKQQFDVFVEKQTAFDAQWLAYKDQVLAQFAQTKQQFNQDFKDLLDQLTANTASLTLATNKVGTLEGACSNLQLQLEKEDARFGLLQKTMIGLQTSKVDAEVYKRDQKEAHEVNNAIQVKLTETLDGQRALENWLEKYEPLKVQHLITDTLAACLNRKSKQKLGEYDLRQCDKLRQAILDDFGNPSFKEKVLDMIAKLERDSNEMVAAGDSSLAKQQRQAEAALPTSPHSQRPANKVTLGVKARPAFAEDEVAPRGNTTMMTGSQMVGDGDEDSEGIENVREEMFAYS